MFRQKYSPKAGVCPGKGVIEHDGDLKKKLFSVKVTLGGHILAEGMVELPSGVCEEKRNVSEN